MVAGNLFTLDPGVRADMSASGFEHGWVGGLPDLVLGAGEVGIGIFETGAPPDVTPWSDIAALVIAPFLVTITYVDGSEDCFPMATASHQVEVLAVIPSVERQRLGLEAPPAVAVAPVERWHSPAPAEQRPISKLWNLLIGGALLQFLGGVLLGLLWDEGALGIALASLVVSVGWSLVVVALIGFGTMLGIKASRSLDHSKE